MNFDKILEGKNEVNEDTNIKNIIELYKININEIVKVLEKTIFKMLIMSNHANVLKDNYSISVILSDYIFDIFNYIEKENNSHGLVLLIHQLMEESNEVKSTIMIKLFTLLEKFYESLERVNLDTESLEQYYNGVKDQLNDFLLINTDYVIDLIYSKVNYDCSFRLKVED